MKLGMFLIIIGIAFILLCLAWAPGWIVGLLFIIFGAIRLGSQRRRD